MQLNNTKNNHYVPKFYLKNFTDRSTNIHFFDKKNNAFHSTNDLRNIAFKANLYTIKNKISKNDIDLFCKMFRVSIDTEEEKFFFDILQNFLNDEFSKLFKIKHENEDVNIFFTKILDSPELSRNQESLFSLYEDDFIPILTYIIKNNEMIQDSNNKDSILVYLFNKITTFVLKKMREKVIVNLEKVVPNIKDEITAIKSVKLCSQNLYYDLLHYILIQYFRTRKIIVNIANGLNATDLSVFNIDTAHNIMFLLIHYQTLNIAAKLMEQNYKIVLLKNSTEKLFFTSDNPSINTHGKFVKDFGVEGIGYEIFFPLSPKMALLVTNTPTMFQNYNKQKSEIIIDNEAEIDYWNDLLFNNAERYIYSSSQEELESFVEKTCKYY